ncbi:unnamed protein product [Fusarium graminearum]|nr:unnamed protein product [Fusarium graminearum]
MDIIARLKVGHNAPHVPKLALQATGKGIRYNAPARPLSAMRKPASNWPPSEQPRASHILRPADWPVEAEYRLLTFAVAANQKAEYVMEVQVRSLTGVGRMESLSRKSAG